MQPLRKSQAMGPSVRNLLSRYKLDPSQIASTGPHQTLLKGDVLSYLSQKLVGNSEQRTQVGGGPPTPHGNLSAPKPGTLRPDMSNYVTQTFKYFPRTPLTQLEIEVINGGGVADPPPSLKGAKDQIKRR